MRLLAARVLPLPALLLLASAPPAQEFEWRQFAGGADHANWRATKNKIGKPEIAWHVGDAGGQPTVLGDRVYSGGRALLLIDAESGEVLAERERGDGPRFGVAPAPALAADRVVARLTDGGLVAYDLELAGELWRYEPEFFSGHAFPPVLTAEHVLVAEGSELVALRLADGAPAWRATTEDAAAIELVPAVAGGRVFAATRAGDVLAVSLATGERLWSTNTGAEFGWTNPVVAHGVLVVGDRGIRDVRRGALNGFDPETGAHLWTSEFGATGLSTPGVCKKDEIVAGYGRYVTRFDVESGEQVKKSSIRTGVNPFGSPTVVDDTVCFGNLDGHLYVHDWKRGKLLWAFHVPGKQVSDFVHAGDRMYVSTTAGLFCLEAKSSKKSRGFVLTWEGA